MFDAAQKPGARSLLYQRQAAPDHPHAVTFDCWSTLIYEKDPEAVYHERVLALLRVAKAYGVEVAPHIARESLDKAWLEHWQRWHRELASHPEEIAFAALTRLDVCDARAATQLTRDFAELAIASEIAVLSNAHETLEALAREKIATALICDTGFSPGVVVRELLRREGLLDLLATQIFSNETGISKPSPRIFQIALAHLQTSPAATVHVGDLRRTDIAGARKMGMATVRITEHHDDRSEYPDADAVAKSHTELRDILRMP